MASDAAATLHDLPTVVPRVGSMNTSRYWVGGEAWIWSVWSDPLQTVAPIDPSTGNTIVVPSMVSATVKRPDGTTETLIVIPNATVVDIDGQAYAQGLVSMARIPFDQPGAWWYAFRAAGSFKGYAAGVLTVRPAPV